MEHLLEGYYIEGKINFIDDMKILGEVAVNDNGWVAVTDLSILSTSTPTFPATYLPPPSDCLDLCVQPLSLPKYLPLYMTLPLSPCLSSFLPPYASASKFRLSIRLKIFYKTYTQKIYKTLKIT